MADLAIHQPSRTRHKSRLADQKQGQLLPACLVLEISLLIAVPQPRLEPQNSSDEAFHVLIEALTIAFQGHLQAIFEQDEAEPVHKARVTLRKLRAAITAFTPVIDDDLADAMLYRARILFRVLGDVRDADVMAARFAGTDRADELAKDALNSRQKARKKLIKIKADGFGAWVLKGLKGKRWKRTGKKAKGLRDAPVTVLAAQSLDRAWKAALSNGPDLTKMSPRAQHELRKDLKVLRYLSEFFAEIWPAAPHDSFLATMRDLQDDLGEVTDLELARALGYTTDKDSTAEGLRAAHHWATLLNAGPWWLNS